MLAFTTSAVETGELWLQWVQLLWVVKGSNSVLRALLEVFHQTFWWFSVYSSWILNNRQFACQLYYHLLLLSSIYLSYLSIYINLETPCWECECHIVAYISHKLSDSLSNGTLRLPLSSIHLSLGFIVIIWKLALLCFCIIKYVGFLLSV